MQVVILSEGSDLDAFSSAYGLTLLYPSTFILLPNVLQYKVSKAISLFQDKIKDKILTKEGINFEKVDKVFVVDSQTVPDVNVPIEIFDHHPNKSLNYEGKNVKLNLYNVGSITTVIVEKIKKAKVNLDKEDATILSLGIYDDTGGFKFSGTTERDLKAFTFLTKSGLDFLKLQQVVSDTFDLEDVEVIKEIIKNAEPLPVEGKKVYISTLYRKYSKDVAWILKYIKPFEPADAYFLVVNQKSKKFIIGRSKDESIDVGKILSQLDGGGHKFAASTTIVGFSYDEIKTFLTFLTAKHQKPLTSFIKTDLPTVEADLSIEEVKSYLGRYRYVVVLQNGRYVGILNDKLINNAIKHGFSNEKAIVFAEELITVSPDVSFIQLLKMFSTYQTDIFPVVEKGYYKGVIYKKEFVSEISGIKEDKPIFLPISKPKTVNYLNRVKKFFPLEIFQTLKEVGEYAEKLGYRAFIIGGVVRDIVLNKENLDVDIIVEGSAVDLIKAYAKDKNFNFYVYPEFMTGVILLPNGLKLDFATARKEEYDSPGSYPKVEKANLFEDLYRRDFTINTLAIEITKSNFGKLIDYFNGLVDIKEKRIRILHSLSFVEDPIRILRALRFAGRLNFKLEKKTENLLIYAVERDLLNFAPTGRINLELNLTFKEENTFEILMLMDRYKVLYKLFAGLSIDQNKEKVLIKLQDSLLLLEKVLGIHFPKNSNYLYVLLGNYPEEITYNLLKKYHFEKEASYLNEFYTTLQSIKNTDSIFDIYKTLKSFNRQFLPALMSLLPEDKFKIVLEMLEKEKKPVLTGEDLIKLGLKPSKIFKDILEDVFVKYLQNSIKTKEEAISYVKKTHLKRLSNQPE
ncbi:MAG: CBS domain-containing protein [Sulfurihydrogenibium sp.]|uniref:CBS domain-containing protein n=1 Tax=Sulfurihydrogenibium sp. TaxID=2053621 RepID=UPI003D148751